jgi:hypothetical protein
VLSAKSRDVLANLPDTVRPVALLGGGDHGRMVRER